MKRFVRFAVPAVAALFLTGFGGVASADDDFESPMTACLANKTAIGDVGSCGKVWKIESGEASLESNGRLHIKVTGLVLDDASTGKFNGTADGVTHVVGAILCSGKLAVQTEWAALSNHGKAQIDTKVNLPSSCIAPTLVVREVWEGKVGGWLAAAGY